MGRASGCSNTPNWTRNDIFDLQRAISMKISVKDGKICNQTTIGGKLERTGEVWIVNETDCFRLDVTERMERRFRSTTPDMRAVLQRRSSLRFLYS